MTNSSHNRSNKHFQQTRFVLSCAELHQCPDHPGGEIAFIGRSNVGKSSLINKLTLQSHLARVSHTPGRTQQLNYFHHGSGGYLVDMPGYGFAKAPLPIVREWKHVAFTYFRTRQQLRCLYVLIDGRHGLKEADLEFMDNIGEISRKWPYAFVLTKVDQLCAEMITQRQHELRTYSAQHREEPDIFLTSSRTLRGPARMRQEKTLNDLRDHITNHLE